MSEDMKNKLHNAAREATKVLGTDINPISLEDRVNMTPVNDVEWGGLRGQSFCKPTNLEMKEILAKYEVDGIQYSLNCEPDFSNVAIANVKISNMTKDLQHDRRATMKRLLKTDWAKENGLTNITQMEEYIKNNHLTIHESLDGLSEYVIEEKIHSFFRHAGGRALYRKFENPESGRFIRTKIKQGVVYTGKATTHVIEKTEEAIENTKEIICKQTEKFISNDYKNIHKSGVNEAVDAAIFAAVYSTTKNTIAVIKGEEGKKEAFKEIIYDVSSAATLGYVTGAVKEVFNISESNNATLLVNSTVQISKQVIAYMQGDIDETKLINNIAETSVMLAAAYAGKLIGAQLIPIPYVGPYIGEMFTTAICSELISVIKETKEFERHNKKIISLYHRAEKEIKVSNLRLSEIVEFENNELKQAIDDGFSNIYKGINMNSYDDLLQGLFIIGSRFGMTEDNFREGTVTKENLFKNVDNVRVIGKRV